MRAKSILTILLISIVAIPALAQDEGPPWDVRPYLSTYTDSTFTWNYTATRHRYVCPYCGYSTTVEDQDGGDYECPNPFGLGSHPANLQLTEATPRQRVLGHLDVTSEDIDGDTANPLVGRPFHPAGTVPPTWNASPSPWEAGQVTLPDQASWMTLRADNLDVSGGGGPLVQNGDGLRFLVVEPGAVRPEA
ncbi:MAG: hypothetical protein GF393_08100, partial [Armatimonadia bacterium]|nr:hypothetical protein [Armatimonadia bacterium]